WGFVDSTGVVVVEPLYDSVGGFFEGLADVQSGGKWGFIDRTGTVVVEPQYEEVRHFSEGLAAVESGGKWGFVDSTGTVVVKPQYEGVRNFSEGLAAVEAGGKWGFIDRTGTLAVEPRFDSVDRFTRAGFAVVWQDSIVGVIDRSGAWRLQLDDETCDIAVSDDGVVTSEEDDPQTGDHTTRFYDLSQGEAKEALIHTANIDLTDYMPFTGKNVAVPRGGPVPFDWPSDRDPLPRLDGATGLFPVYAAYAQALYPQDTRFQMPADGISPLVTCTKTNAAYERLIAGEADVIFVLQPSDEESQMAAARGESFDMLPIGYEAFVFITNSRNPCGGLSLDQIRRIYAGQITEWSEVGVDGLGSIVPYQRPKNSGSQTALEALMDGMPLMPAPEEIVSWDMDDILEAVEYRNLANALGYTFRFFCKGMMRSEVRMLAVDGIEPTEENIRSGRYPITSTLYAVRLASNTANPNVNALWDWLRSDTAAELLESSGYVAKLDAR
ncbi:MAG: WG repeat-containing protein, partial [Clostridia bacterium]|nr:WG repeat-containing protein [Clostridia bacterium]